MKKIKVLSTLYFLFFYLPLLACDVCGNYMGITPYDNKSSISFLHRYRVFNGYKNYQTQSHFFPTSAYRTTHGDPLADSAKKMNHNYSSKDFESYKIFELRCKYFATKRIEVNVFLPLLDNKSKTDTIFRHHAGVGDISFNAGFHVITPKVDSKIKHKLILGAGLKLPLGNYYAHDNNSDRLPFEMQAGTGSTDYFGYLNYVCMAKKTGINVSLNYKVNGLNNFQERIGNSHNDFVSIFYKITYKKIILFPSLQANYEFTKGLSIKKVLQENTSVHSLLLGPGFDIYYKSFSLNTSWQFTIAEKMNDGYLKSTGRISVGINYSFNKTEKK